MGINVKIAVVRMLLAKVVAGMDLGFVSGPHLAQRLDEGVDLGVGEFSAKPRDQ
ncbi:MAG: hypothetical protein ACRD3O_01355 [Terriglobia bacterium]